MSIQTWKKINNVKRQSTNISDKKFCSIFN